MKWELLDRKAVRDADGFWTEYCLYSCGDMYVCIFGDSDIYRPEDEDWDFETDDEDMAWKWFMEYDGFTEEDL